MLWFLYVIDLLVHCHHHSIDYVSNMAVPFEVIYYCSDDYASTVGMQTWQSDHCSNLALMQLIVDYIHRQMFYYIRQT